MEGRSITRLSLDLVALESPRFKSLSLEVSARDEQFLSLPDRRKAGIAKLLHLGVEISPGIIRDPGLGVSRTAKLVGARLRRVPVSANPVTVFSG